MKSAKVSPIKIHPHLSSWSAPNSVGPARGRELQGNVVLWCFAGCKTKSHESNIRTKDAVLGWFKGIQQHRPFVRCPSFRRLWIQVPTLCMSVPCTCSAATDFKSTISSVKSSQRFAACLGITLGGLGLITQVISRKGLYKDRHGIRRYACYLQHIWRRW